jgi:hypothetical protein
LQTADDPLLACVTENTSEWFLKAHNLMLSLREFGGAWKEAPVVVNFVGSVEPEYKRTLADLGADVQVVDPYGSRYRFSNKMRMFDLFDGPKEFDVLVALDCDVLVMGDLSPLTPAGPIGIVPAGRDLMSLDDWQVVYEMFGLTPPEPDCIMRISGQRTYPYYNTGVMTIPRPVGAELVQTWTDMLSNFGPVHERFERIHHENQIAFALAVRAGNWSVHELPASLNFSTAASLDRRFRHELEPPFVVHYHHAIDQQGFIEGSPSKRVNRAIDKFNRFRAREVGFSYEGLVGLPLMTRMQKSARTRTWYKTKSMRRVRRSPLVRAIKRMSAAGVKRT